MTAQSDDEESDMNEADAIDPEANDVDEVNNDAGEDEDEEEEEGDEEEVEGVEEEEDDDGNEDGVDADANEADGVSDEEEEEEEGSGDEEEADEDVEMETTKLGNKSGKQELNDDDDDDNQEDYDGSVEDDVDSEEDIGSKEGNDDNEENNGSNEDEEMIDDTEESSSEPDEDDPAKKTPDETLSSPITKKRKSSPNKIDKTIELGGENASNGTPAYALLTGLNLTKDVKGDDGSENDETDSEDLSSKDIISLPITRLPAMLGRDHVTKDPNFIGLKEAKLLSRVHCCIFYRDAYGGKLGHYDPTLKKEDDGNGDGKNDAKEKDKIEGEGGNSEVANKGGGTPDGMIYIQNELDANDDSSKPDNIIRLPSMSPDDPLPKSGFFAIQCLGRHKIRVGGKWLQKGQQAMLEDGIPIRISSYCLYFLLPKNTPTSTMQVKVSTSSVPDNKKTDEAKEPTTASIKEEETINTENLTTKPTTSADSSIKLEESTTTPTTIPSTSTTSLPKLPPTKKPRLSEDNASFSIAPHLDKLSTPKLLALLAEAVKTNEWDRNYQLVGSTLAIRAMRAAARSKIIQRIAVNESGVSQREIMDWVKESKVFKDYESMMLSKIERKSFLTSIGKAIVRAGYTRNETILRARAHRWNLPKDIMANVNVGSVSNSPKSGGKGGGGGKKKAVKKVEKKEETEEIVEGKEEEAAGEEKGGEEVEESSEQEEVEDEDEDEEEGGEGGAMDENDQSDHEESD